MTEAGLQNLRRVALGGALFVCVLFVASSAFAGGYIPWDSVKSLPGQGTSPHGGYTTGTVKCGVCHAVHGASAATSSPAPQLLLQSAVADACNYCHVGGAGGYTQVYAGNPANYSGTDLKNAHNSFLVSGVQQGITCTKCHQVHAADSAMTANAYLTTKLLVGAKTYSNFPLPNYDPVAQAPLSTDTSDTALMKWCAGCHFTRGGSYTYYADAYNGQSHIMTTPTASYTNPGTTYTGQIAWKGSNYCASCHSSGYRTAAWPHYTAGTRFLESAADASTTPTAAVDSRQDGVCLQCHRSTTSGAGVGF